MQKPEHVAIIMDGNRRWAKKRGLATYKGHENGKKAIEECLKGAKEANIKYLTLWAMSLDNIKKRSEKEINNLMQLFREGFMEVLGREEVHKNEIRINVYGRWKEFLPEKVKKPIKKVIKETKNYNNRYLNFLISYSGTDEMLHAIRKILEKNKKSRGKITKETVKNNLFTADLPPVDLMIRTGGEPHNSNGFMMWDIANAQYHFSKKLWPDFNKSDFLNAIQDYKSRRKKYGK